MLEHEETLTRSYLKTSKVSSSSLFTEMPPTGVYPRLTTGRTPVSLGNSRTTEHPSLRCRMISSFISFKIALSIQVNYECAPRASAPRVF